MRRRPLSGWWRVAASPADRQIVEQDQKSEEREPHATPELEPQRADEEKPRHAEKKRKLALEHGTRHFQRCHDRGTSEDEPDIGNVAPEHVPHRHLRMAAERRDDARYDLGRRRSISDNREANEQRAHPEMGRESGRSAYEPVRTESE